MLGEPLRITDQPQGEPKIIPRKVALQEKLDSFGASSVIELPGYSWNKVEKQFSFIAAPQETYKGRIHAFINDVKDLMSDFDPSILKGRDGYITSETHNLALPSYYFDEGVNSISVHFYPDPELMGIYDEYRRRSDRQKAAAAELERKVGGSDPRNYLGIGIEVNALRVWENGEDLSKFYSTLTYYNKEGQPKKKSGPRVKRLKE